MESKWSQHRRCPFNFEDLHLRLMPWEAGLWHEATLPACYPGEPAPEISEGELASASNKASTCSQGGKELSASLPQSFRCMIMAKTIEELRSSQYHLQLGRK